MEAPVAIFLADPSWGVAEQVGAWAGDSGDDFSLSSFATACQLLRRMEYERPDILLLDVTMPHFDGLTALRSPVIDRIPVVLISPDTLAGARLTIEALLRGATGYLLKRGCGRSSRLTMNRSGFLRWLRLLQRLRLEKDGPGRWPRGLSCCGSAGTGAVGGSVWVQLGAADGGLEAFPPEREPLMRDGEWMALALASSRSLPLLVDAMSAAPERPAGPVVLSVPQSRRFGRALREAVSRRWNRAVLDLEGGERLRPGQWRLLPGRLLMAPRGWTHGVDRCDLRPNRLTDERRSAVVQLQLFEAIGPGLLQVFLVEQPQGLVLDSVRKLVLKGHTAFLHADALGTWDPDAPERMAHQASPATVACPGVRAEIWRGGRR